VRERPQTKHHPPRTRLRLLQATSTPIAREKPLRNVFAYSLGGLKVTLRFVEYTIATVRNFPQGVLIS